MDGEVVLAVGQAVALPLQGWPGPLLAKGRRSKRGSALLAT